MTTATPITDDELVAALPSGRTCSIARGRPGSSPRGHARGSPDRAMVARGTARAVQGGATARRATVVSRRLIGRPWVAAAVAFVVVVIAVSLSNVRNVPATRPWAAQVVLPASTAGFSPTGSMQIGREMVSATTLPDGRVLVVGGWESQDDATAELWDPHTGTFNFTGSLPEPREGQTATLLPDGKVLVVGGYKYKAISLADAELSKSATTKFAPAGTLEVARRGHAAVLLPDGGVLIVGGDSPGSVASATQTADTHTSELWDPSPRNALPSAGSSPVSEFPPAELRPDGRVMVVGETQVDPSSRAFVLSAQLAEPTTLSFSPFGTLARPNGLDTAAILSDGRNPLGRRVERPTRDRIRRVVGPLDVARDPGGDTRRSARVSTRPRPDCLTAGFSSSEATSSMSNKTSSPSSRRRSGTP